MLRLVFSPFKEIAKQLKRLADLYELELGERVPPIMLRLEKPNAQIDTEILTDGAYDQEPVWKRILAFQNPQESDYTDDE